MKETPATNDPTTSALAAQFDDPRPVVWAVKLHTPLTSQYMRCFHALYSDPDCPARSGEGWIEPNRGGRSVVRIEVDEPEFGRGIIFHVRGTARRAAKEAERMTAAARFEFSPHERSLLESEQEVGRRAILRDAEEGI